MARLLVGDRSGNSGSAQVQFVWDMSRSELELVPPETVPFLKTQNDGNDVDAAWNTWRTAAELELVEEYQHAAAPVSSGPGLACVAELWKFGFAG